MYGTDAGAAETHKFPLSGTDAERRAALDEGANLHEIVATDPRAAVRCFHEVVQLVFESILDCTPPPSSSRSAGLR